MKKAFIVAGFFFVMALQLQAQNYQPATQQTDSFSIALMQLLNCGINKFDDCQGDFFQTTMMSQREHYLTIKFPNSLAGIIRSGDWDKNAYVEFGPYKDRYSMAKALKELKQKIKKALGKQFFDDKRSDSLLYYAMNIEDENGHFQSSFELLTGTTREKSYLLTPTINTVNKSKPEHNFILLKVQGGIPSYYYNIQPGLHSPNDSLHLTLKQLIRSSVNDFKGLVPDSFFMKQKFREWKMNGIEVIGNFGGGNRTAIIKYPIPADSVAQQNLWAYYQLIMQAAAGSDYIYNISKLDTWQYIVYFNKNYDQKQPRLYLQLNGHNTPEPYIELQVQSPVTHPMKRSRSYSWDE